MESVKGIFEGTRPIREGTTAIGHELIHLLFGCRMKWSRDHVLTWGYMRNLMFTVDTDAKVCFPRGPSGGNI
jgi:hypothetical protein